METTAEEMERAATAASTLMAKACRHVAEMLGSPGAQAMDIAVQHPHLVAGFMQAAATAFLASSLRESISDLAGRLESDVEAS